MRVSSLTLSHAIFFFECLIEDSDRRFHIKSISIFKGPVLSIRKQRKNSSGLAGVFTQTHTHMHIGPA